MDHLTPRPWCRVLAGASLLWARALRTQEQMLLPVEGELCCALPSCLFLSSTRGRGATAGCPASLQPAFRCCADPRS